MIIKFHLVGLQEVWGSEHEGSSGGRSLWPSEQSDRRPNSWWTSDDHDSNLAGEDTSSPEKHRDICNCTTRIKIKTLCLKQHETWTETGVETATTAWCSQTFSLLPIPNSSLCFGVLVSPDSLKLHHHVPLQYKICCLQSQWQQRSISYRLISVCDVGAPLETGGVRRTLKISI